jgi:type II secretory pathway component PulF
MVTFMMVFIIPRITESFVKAKVEIPALTQGIINVSNFIIDHYIILILALIGLAVGTIIFRATYYGQLIFSKVALKLPVF